VGPAELQIVAVPGRPETFQILRTDGTAIPGDFRRTSAEMLQVEVR
jgi:hypothetical protein